MYVVDITKMRRNREIKNCTTGKKRVRALSKPSKENRPKDREQFNSLTDDQPLERDQSTKSTVPVPCQRMVQSCLDVSPIVDTDLNVHLMLVLFWLAG